jgi:hypothetical protein
LATDTGGSLVAVKVIRPEIADAPNVRQRLVREAESLIKVQGQRTVKLIEINADAPSPYLVMQYVEGQDLSTQIAEEGPLRGAMLRVVFLALVEALRDIHSASIIHRDLKPSNIIIGSDGVHVVDFGISAIQEEASLTGTGAVVGTAAWMSPEQVEGSPVGPEADIFNLGLVMAYIATGAHPFGAGRPDALMYRIVHGEPNLDGVPTQYRSVINQCLSKNPTSRPSLSEIESSLQSSINSADEVISSGTFVISSTELKQQISDDMNNQSSSVPNKTSRSAQNAKFVRLIKRKGVIAASSVAILLAVPFGANYAFSSEPTTTTTTTSTTTTIPIVPKFELYRFKGKAIRWDSCRGSIQVAVNFGSLTSQDSDIVTTAVTNVLAEVSRYTGLNFEYAGATSRIPAAKYRSGRQGTEAIVIAFALKGKGLPDAQKYVFGTFMSYAPHSGDWHEFETVDAQFPDNWFSFTPTFVTRRVRQLLLNIIGLTWVESDHEIVGTNGDTVNMTQNDYGPGDVQGMSRVGASQGCIE